MSITSATTITLGTAESSIDEIIQIADGAPVSLATDALQNMDRVHSYVRNAIDQGK